MRQIILDTETTGIDPRSGHRIIEIGCIEMVNRKLTGNHYHEYINPQRAIEEEAIEVHGITNEYLADKPLFHQVADSFLEFIKGAELVIHNAPFDVGFIDNEFRLLNRGHGKVYDHCTVIDTLVMAREMHPGQRNSLDALCKRYGVDNTGRVLHGALLDSEILADVYLFMTGGQTDLSLGQEGDGAGAGDLTAIRRVDRNRAQLKVIAASSDERRAHELKLDALGEACIWRQP